MLPKVHELINQLISTNDNDVRDKTLQDLVEYQSINDTICDLKERICESENELKKIKSLKESMDFHLKICSYASENPTQTWIIRKGVLK